MNVGDFACESWRDNDPSISRWAAKPPVWEIVDWGQVARVRAIGGNQTASIASGELRPATDEEVQRAKAAV